MYLLSLYVAYRSFSFLRLALQRAVDKSVHVAYATFPHSFNLWLMRRSSERFCTVDDMIFAPSTKSTFTRGMVIGLGKPFLELT